MKDQELALESKEAEQMLRWESRPAFIHTWLRYDCQDGRTEVEHG
jgi:hypothetical protein